MGKKTKVLNPLWEEAAWLLEKISLWNKAKPLGLRQDHEGLRKLLNMSDELDIDNPEHLRKLIADAKVLIKEKNIK